MAVSCCDGVFGTLKHENESVPVAFDFKNRTDDNDGGGFPPDTHFKFVSDFVAFMFNVAVYAFLSGCVSFVGIFANVINIAVFIRQGVLNESSNVSLLALAVADLCSVTTMLWMSVGFSVVLADPKGLSWVPYDVAYVTAIWPHIMSAQMTRMITAYVAFERCICVVFPFKVKRLFTPRRSLIIVGCIFAYCLLSYSPIFVVHQLRNMKNPNTNKTQLSLYVTEYRQLIVDIVSYINSIVFNIGSVATVLFCTMITVSRVKLSKSWRESVSSQSTTSSSITNKPENSTIRITTTTTTQKGNSKNTVVAASAKENNLVNSNENVDTKKLTKSTVQKEMRLVRMITLISAIFLVCYCPDLTFLIMISVNKQINVAGRYTNLAHLMYSLTFLMESINSSINIIVYYNMSSRYKQEFKQLFKNISRKREESS